jgi:amino acid adenylation domain-containing protein
LSFETLIDHLRTLDVQLWAEGDRLRFRAPQGALTDDLRDALKAQKDDILGFLRQAQGARDGALPPIARAPRDGDLPLSSSQERLWFLEQWQQQAGTAYNLIDAVRLRGVPDVAVLARCLREITRRHEILRTTYASRNGRPVQVVAPEADLHLAEVDLRVLPAGLREAAAREVLEELARLPFDLAAGPVLRAALLHLDTGEHRLLLELHHIASDGWSSGVMIGELSRLYALWTAESGALPSPLPSPLPALPLQYADYAVWQRQWLESPGFTTQLAFWKERLAGAEGVLELPTDRPRPAVQSFRGGTRRFQLGSSLCAALDRRAEAGTTRFMALLAGFAALLHRITGASDLLIGTPVANRRRPEVEPLIGFFVNTLVLRSELAGDPTAGAFLDRTRDGILEAFARQDVPFEKLVEELRPERDPSRSPLFQVLFVLQNAPAAPLSIPGLVLEPEILENDTAKFDLSLSVEDGAAPLAAALEYATDLFDATTAERLAAAFARLAADLLAHPERRLSELALLSEAERTQVLLEWNDSRTAYPREACIHDLVAEWAERTPDAVAVVWGEEELSYRELDERAGLLARRLRACGVGPDVRVAVLLDRSADLVIALLAVLKAGGAFVPLDPAYPEERLTGLMEDARASVLVTGPGLQVTEAGSAGFQPAKGGGRQDGGAPSETPQVLPDNLAYVMFTSGTTGRPKGVAVPHRAVVRLVRGNHFARLDSSQVLLLLAPASFDAATLEIWGALANGGRLVVYPGPKPTLKELGEVLERHQVSTLWLTAGLFHQMVEHNVQGLRPVRQLLSGGDVLSPQHVREALEALPGCTVINGYGPTENTTFTCCFAMTDPAAVGEAVPIGRPIANSRAIVVDRDLRPLPVGARGELLAGGDGLARGYLDRPDLTAERFVPDPTAGLLGRPGDRVYRTGDLVRLLPDGRIDFLGRVDQQVKIRGFRIEPAEIEAALASHPAVAAAVVLARPGRSGVKADRELAAYLLTRPGTEVPAAAELRDFVRARLPEPMVPTAWVFLEELPLTAHGKVDRRALAEIRTQLTAELTAPQTPTEEVTAGLWAEVLGRAAVGIHESFFDLGGHSLLAVQIVARMEQAFGVAVPLRHLFEAPTVAGLSERIDRLLAAGGAAALPPVVPVPHDRPLPLSFSQERLWLFEQLVPDNAVYTTTRAAHLRGPLDLAALRATFGEILRRHEVLRTGYHAGPDGRPVQIVEPWRPADLPLIDLRGVPAERREAEALRLGNEEGASPMPLDRPPLVRAAVLLLGPEEHLVLLSIHHICWDLGSGGVLLRELDALYPAFAQGRPSPLADLPLQYADFAVWQRGWLTGEVLEEQLAWWRANLAGVEARPLVLPSDRPRPAVETWRGAMHHFLIPRRVAEPLRQLGRTQGATVFMTYLALFQTLLARYAPQPDLVVGTAISNRSDPALEGLIGFFDNLLPLRTATADAGELGFQQFLGRVREVALNAYTHQHLPFELLVQELRLERERSRTPLLQVIFLFQLDYPAMTRELAGLSMHPYQLRVETAKFDLTFALREGPDGLVGQVEHNTDLFDATTIQRLVGHYEILVEAVLAAPTESLGELPLMTAAERFQVLEEWSDTRAPEAALVPEQVAAQAARQPGALAVVGGAEALTYGDLDARAERLAGRLRRLGVGPEVRVGVCAGRTPRLAVALLAIWKAGGAYLPLDPAYPSARIDFMLTDAAAPVLLTERALAGRFAVPGLKVLFLEDVSDANISGGRVETPAAPLLPEQTAYVIYTSGSTGTPKGVEVSHDALRRLTGWHLRAFGVTAKDVATLLAGLGFDAAVWEIWPALAAGARLEMPDEAVRTVPEALRDWLLARGATVSFAPTPLAEALMALPWPPEAPLRLLLTGGDRLHRPPAVGLPFTLVNNYGPTENTVVATSGTVPPSPSHAPSIGRPIDHVTARVVDAGLQPLPAILPGELVIGGASLARGYLGRPELTAERFVPDPWSPRPGARLYRTGDLVRWLPDGSLDFLGRIDQQVKIRGFRVELGEIEAALAACPGVEATAVLAPESADGSRRLVAYVVGGADPAALRHRLAERLPEHMIPALFLPLPALPLTPNGKVDRRALPEPAAESEAGFVAPSDPLEELLAGLWADLLGRERVGVRDDFFALGGHSLLATQLMSRLRDVVGVELPLHALFEGATVAELARAVRAAQSSAVPPPPPLLRLPLALEERRSGLPLSFAQQRLWFLDQLEPDSPAYNIPATVRLSGAVPADRLARIFAEVVRRHEALRTTFATREGRPIQVIAEDLEPDLPLLDLSGLPAGERESQAHALAADEAARPFDLERGPLLRLFLVRLGARDHLLLMTFHHIVADGWSMGVLLREVGAFWQALAAGKPARLPELPVQYADFAAWQRSWLQGEVLESQIGFWRRQLAGAPRVLDLPTDHPRPAQQTFRGAMQPVRVAPPLAARVHEICRREGATPFMVLLAAWAALLGRHAGQEDVLLGTPIAGRNRGETEGLIGFFVNTLVLRADLRWEPTFARVLSRVRAAALDAYAHQDVPFERLVEELVPERDPAHSPLFQVLFTVQNAPLGELEVPGLSLTPLSLDSGIAKFDLTLSLGEDSSGFPGTLEHNTDLFDATTAERLGARFLTLLEGAVAAPGRVVTDLPLLLPDEWEQVLWTHNATATEYPRESSLAELFAAVARELPEAPAIVSGDEIWTYRRLDEVSNRLARHLRSLGVGIETPVGISLERSAELIVGTLAIVKAGGVYVPLDAAYPDERLAFMLEDTGAGVVLVHEPTRERLSRLAPRLVSLDGSADGGAWQSEDAAALAVPVPAECLGYVIYTSGSTGRPKGVAVPHRAIVRLVRETNYLRLGPGDRTGQVSNSSFDVATYEIWGALLTGAATVVIPREVVLSPPDFAVELRRQRVTSMFLTSALFIKMAGEAPEAFAEMSELLVGGEAVDPVAARTVLAGRPPRRLLNGYGPTESTGFASWHHIREVPEGATTVPIGLPLANTTLYVLDRRQSAVPPGVLGELCIGGDGLARCYLNRPELTAEKFVPHPWGTGERLYRTGDLVRQRPDGPIEYLGRIDHQVKIRGFRIEPGEIEAVLAGHPEMRECAVLARRDNGETRLVAYVVGRGGGAPRAEDLREWLLERLPDYMVPSAYVVLDALPITANGKLDRKALPAPERGRGGTESGGPGPRDALELELVRLWEELLGVGPIGVRDDFFTLGGHSLLAVQLAARLRRRLGRTVPIAALLRHSTVERLAALLRQDEGMPLRRSILVELAPGSGKPLFLVHPIGGEVLSYVHLARRLAGRSVWGIQAPETSETPETIEARAAAYLRAVREVQPEGPYLLGGWSLGGVLAFEMARQLESGGEAVEAVLLLDSPAPEAGGAARRLPDSELVAAFALDLGQVLGIDSPAGLDLDGSDLGNLAEQAGRSGLLPPGLDAAELERRFSRWTAHLRALERYAGGPCAARLVLLKAAERAAEGVLPEDLGWGRLAAVPVEVHELEGDHYTLLREPGVEKLAELVRERLLTLAAAP